VTPLVVVDADVLGRRRTGEETYVLNLLRGLPAAAPDLRIAAVTREPELVPEGIEPIALPARFQETRMAWSLPRLLRRVRPSVAHFQHALPLGWRGPSVLTLHDLHFEREPATMGLLDRVTFKTVVPRSARGADQVVTVSERTRDDAHELYGVPLERITVTPHGVDPAFVPGNGDGEGDGSYLLFVGAVQARKDPLAALEAAQAVGLPLVVAGPEKELDLAQRLRAGGADLRGYVEKDELADLYRGAAALLLLSRYEGFGLPVLEAMACGTPVVLSGDAALREVAGDAAVYVDDDRGDAVRRALAERERLAAAGIERARSFTWSETARLTAAVYRRVLA
jgi:glycosyltransferase involved in cell wall biosynthesis